MSIAIARFLRGGVAAFAVDLIAHLESKPGALSNETGLLPAGVAWNVNYPTVAPEDVQGVKLTVQGQASSPSLVFIPIGGDIFVPTLGSGIGDEEDVIGSDTVALEEGFITVTPINSDMTASRDDRSRFNSVIAGLEP